mgnify:CR=1 FL=1
MAKKKTLGVPPAMSFLSPATPILPTEDCPKVEEYEYPLIVKKQAKRLLGLFNLPEDHPGRDESIREYQGSLMKKGIENPPINRREAEEFYSLTGEFHG